MLWSPHSKHNTLLGGNYRQSDSKQRHLGINRANLDLGNECNSTNILIKGHLNCGEYKHNFPFHLLGGMDYALTCSFSCLLPQDFILCFLSVLGSSKCSAISSLSLGLPAVHCLHPFLFWHLTSCRGSASFHKGMKTCVRRESLSTPCDTNKEDKGRESKWTKTGKRHETFISISNKCSKTTIRLSQCYQDLTSAPFFW
jgi:hypothetical protein